MFYQTVDYPAGSSFTDKAYTYDAAGNRISTVNGSTTNYTSNNLNQYIQAGNNRYTYDATGNLTSDGTFTYAYDYENRLITANKTGTSAAYKYDSFGRRIEKTVGSASTKFLYDGDQIIAEYDSSGNISAKYIFGPGIDEPISITKEGQTYYYHSDGLGSVTCLTDSNGTIVESYSYDVFGRPSVTSSLGNRFMFTGREYDAETDLYFYRARYYSPRIGRFLQRDRLTWAPNDPRILDKNNDLISFSSACYTIHPELKNDNERFTEILKAIIFYYHPETYRTLYSQSQLEIEATKFFISLIGKHNPTLFHSYTYCFNNSINYVDPKGEIVPWIAITSVIVIIAIATHQFAYYLGKFQVKPEEPGPPIQPYMPPNPLQHDTTGWFR